MCQFCETLTDGNKEIVWSARSTMADDNITDIISERGQIVEELSKFEIYGYEREGKTFVGIQYREEMVLQNKEKVIISPFSETIQFNFCPICGKQISDEVKKFGDYYVGQISIYEKEQ